MQGTTVGKALKKERRVSEIKNKRSVHAASINAASINAAHRSIIRDDIC
jgi:hypothetical protein